MKRALATVAFLAFAANAQDKGKSDFTHNAEFRVRDTFEQNESGNSSVKPAKHNGVDQRFKLGLGFKANEKFWANATLLQSASWGQSASETPIGDRSQTVGGDETNFMSVNEAYATWMMSEAFTMKFGRQNFAFGDGSIMSINDWQAQPYAFDGVTGHYELDFGHFTAFAFKYRDFSGPQGTNYATAGAISSDPQHDAYGLVFDLKNMPEWLKMVNAYVIQDVGDGVGATPESGTIGSTGNTIQTSQKQNALRYGALASGAFSMVDAKLGYNMVTGKNTDINPNGSEIAPSRTINENMLQAEVGVNLPNIMMSRFYVSYHQDSGTDQSSATTKSNTYDPYFTDRHTGAGLMEIVGWGNLTDIALGWTAKPTDSTDVGVSYNMFTKTQSTDNINPGTYGRNLFMPNGAVVACGAANPGGPACHSGIGNEIDVWTEHRYEGGLSMIARVGYFMPGSQLKDSVQNQTANITQLMVQGKMTF